MRPHGTILIPVDLSEASVPALRFAQDMAKSYEARLVLLHVVDEAPAIWRFGWPGATRASSSPNHDAVDSSFEKWLASVGADRLPHERRIAAGGAGAEIVRVARELPADFVVLATHGNTGLQARFMGGTAYQVLRAVRCPVASIKPPGFGDVLLRMWEGIQLFGDSDEAAEEIHRHATFPPATILHPTDFSEASQHATRVAARMASHTGARLVVLHVDHDHPLPDVTEKLAQVGMQVEAMGAAPPQTVTRRGDPSSEVLRESIHCTADIVVMGSEGIGGLSVLSVGSTAARVVRQASCPVVTLRADTSLREIDREFRKVYHTLSVATLRTSDDEEQGSPGIDDLVRSAGSEYFLGFYTRTGFVRALEEYGIMQDLRNLGYRDLRPSFDLSDSFDHVFRIHSGPSDDRDHLLIEATLRPGTIEVPVDSPDAADTRFPVLVALWLCMQHPKGEFSARKPPMPDQVYPGLGLGREMLEIFVLIAQRLGKTALVNRPMHLHNARYYHHKFRFLDPRMEGRLAAILRDTDGVSMADASWALHLGFLRDLRTGEAVRWEGREQVFPMCDDLRAYFESREYRRAVWATAIEERFEIDWDQFERRASQPPASRD